MIYSTFKKALWGFALLVSAGVSAQETDSELQLSTDKATYWYRICNATPGMEDYAMTDPNPVEEYGEEHDDALRMAVYLLPTETENHNSQWKLTAGEDGKVILTNRATDFQISNTSFSRGDHNVTWLASSGTPGFTVTSLGDNAFRLESVEDDGVNRCLALAERDGEALVYPQTGESTSIVGWKFLPVEVETGIGTDGATGTVIRVKGKHISVSGCQQWRLFDAAGTELPHTVSLPAGVYVVELPQKTVKVMMP